MNSFDELNKIIETSFKYTPMTDEDYQISVIKDVVEWADEIAGQWDGDNDGSEEDRAIQADEIMQKANELIELIEGMKEL